MNHIDNIVGMIDPESIYETACTIAKHNPSLDALFISCTNLKTASHYYTY